MKYQYNPLLTEGYKLKTFLLDLSGGNLSREAANTEKIIAKYPTANDLIAGLQRLLNDPRCNSRAAKTFRSAIAQLQNPIYQNASAYREFVRKNLSGASGFWKYVFLCLFSGSVIPYMIYKLAKVHRVEDQMNNQSADDAMLAMNRRTMFR